MSDHLKLDLARHTDEYHRSRIANELSMSLMGIYDSIDDARDDVRVLERQINDILYGTVPTPSPWKACGHA